MNSHAHNRMQQPLSDNRIILLGASNLTLSLRLVIQLMQHRCGGSSDVLVAAGHGRSYGQNSQMLIRELPGITCSGLWSRLDLTDARPIYAFLTDVGNDILYGYQPEQILVWVSWCVEQLQRQSAHIVMTNLPIESIESLSEQHFRIFRAIFYPFCRLSRREVVDRARTLHRGLAEMASSKCFDLYEQEKVWFGPDAVHVRYWKRQALYQHIFEQFPAFSGSRESVGDRVPCFPAWKQRPQFAYKTILGQECHHQQPSGQLADGTAISLY